MLLFGLLGFGVLVGAIAQFIVGRDAKGMDWGMAIGAGLIGSFVGGLLISLLSGDGIELRASGLIGSVVGALVVTLLWTTLRNRSAHP